MDFKKIKEQEHPRKEAHMEKEKMEKMSSCHKKGCCSNPLGFYHDEIIGARARKE